MPDDNQKKPVQDEKKQSEESKEPPKTAEASIKAEETAVKIEPGETKTHAEPDTAAPAKVDPEKDKKAEDKSDEKKSAAVEKSAGDGAAPVEEKAKEETDAKPEATEEKVKKRDAIDPAEAHVLVVEDNVPNFVLIARMLAYMGVQRCEWKTSGWQVVEFADTLPRIDLVLMDIRLPYEDGFQALEKLRANPRLKDTLVIAVTAEASVEQMNKAKASGFDGFLGKPLDPDRFPDQIRRVLNGEEVWEMQ